MTYPGSGGPWQPDQNPQQGGGWGPGQQPGQQYPQQGQPQQTPPGGYPQDNPGYQQGGYPTGPQPTGQYPTGQYPTGQFPAGQYPPPGQQAYGAGYAQPGTPKRGRRGMIIGIVVAVVVVAGGAGATVWALNRSSDQAGSASPQAAVAKLVADVSNGDVLGLQSDIAPAEAALLKDTSSDGAAQLKRLQVVNPSYNPQSTSVNATSGLSAKGLTFDDNAAQTINDHLTINKLVSGTITVSPKLDNSVLSQQFVQSVFPNGLPRTNPMTVNIADLVRQTGQPIRIATIKVNGGWYTSLFYTAADYALQTGHVAWPTTSLPATGAGSADAAVQQFVQALLDANFTAAIELTDPNEMAALHDAGQSVVNAIGRHGPTGVKIDSVSFADKPVTGGVDTVLQSATLEIQGDQLNLTRSGSCYQVADRNAGQQRQLCGSDLASGMGSGLGALPPEIQQLFAHLSNGMLGSGVGLVATEVNGKWYVSPVRSFSQLVMNVFASLQPGDLKSLFTLGQH